MRFLFSAVLFLSSILAFSQNTVVTGQVKDTVAKEMVNNAVIALLSPKDSIIRTFTRSDANGEFSLNKANPGNYILLVMHQKYADYTDNIVITEGSNNLNTLSLMPKSKLLQEVIIRGVASIRVKGDTTIYNADSFKVSANANVEELLKKLPGLQVDKNGTITAMGKTVEKVLVDGEEFFGEDPGMAVKNLRADAVKEVQVFDKKSEQSEFTGIDDGKTQKTINLKLKEDKKKGYFGKIDLAAGPAQNVKPRFNNNLMFGSFKGKRKVSAFALNGNTGQDGLNWDDSEKYGGGSDNVSFDAETGTTWFFGGMGSSDDEPYVNTENGFTRNVNLGANYNNKWNDKHSFSFSPKYNEQDYENGSTTYIEQLMRNDTMLISREQRTSAVDRKSWKLRSVYDVKLDSNSSLKVTLNTNFYNSASETHSQNITTGKSGNLKNETSGNNSNRSDKTAISGNILYKYKFKRDRRTFSFNANFSRIQNDGISLVDKNNIDYFYNVSAPINQHIANDKTNATYSFKGTYTEPLNKKYALEFSHEVMLTRGLNNQITHSLNPLTNLYDQKVDSMTNDFDQRITIQRPSIKLAYNHKKMRFNLGTGFGFTKFNLQDKTNSKDYKRDYTNYFPNANFIYTYKSNRSFRIGYNGNTSQPSLNQLQPIRNVNSLFYQYIGNPDLKPSFNNNFDIGHNAYNFIKDLWMSQNFTFSTTSNAIVNKSKIDFTNGKTTVQPVNVNGNYSMNFWSGLGFKIKKIDTRVWTNLSGNMGRSKTFVNDTLQTNKNSGIRMYYGLTHSKQKKYEFSIDGSWNYSINKVLPTSTVNKFFNWSISSNAEVFITKTFSISAEYNGSFQPANSNIREARNVHLVNGGLKKTFKDNQFTLYLKVRDILDQNTGINRYSYSNVYQEETQQRLRRYGLIGFRWDFKNKAPKAESTNTTTTTAN